MSRTIPYLPPEVLRLVLSEVRTSARRDRSQAFLNAITTCRLWSDIGVDLLWTDVSLSGTQFFKFARTIIPQSHSQRIRSLSIKVPTYSESWMDACSAYYDRTAIVPHPHTGADVWIALAILSEKVGLMTSLSCFSFVVPSLFNGSTSYRIDRSDILPILQSLPSSVRHLELDSNDLKASVTYPTLGLNLCAVIRERMGGLSNLRLGANHFCPTLFSPWPDSIWVETKAGHRLPHEYYQAETRFDSTPLRISSIRELRRGRKTQNLGSLLTVQESNGFENIGSLTRNLTREELRFKAQIKAQQITGGELWWRLGDLSANDVGIDIPLLDNDSGNGEGTGYSSLQ